MYKELVNFENLIECVKQDKCVIGSEASTLDRYPIRFVLFDNFDDSFEFVQQIQSEYKCIVKSVEEWISNDFDDILITHSLLAENIKSYISSVDGQDTVITPFSELARFYNNTTSIEFYSLISTIKSIESNILGFGRKQRVYIPIVGLEGKMAQFHNDPQINIWYLKSSEYKSNYKFILTQSVYGVKGIESKFTYCRNVRDWLKLWKSESVRSEIISTSTSLYINAENAQPDNAFTFCRCSNVSEFLKYGINLDIEIPYDKEEDIHWKRLASEIDCSNFNYDRFVNNYFRISELADSYVFLKTWFDYNSEFERWLLKNYYLTKFCGEGYICKVLRECRTLSNVEFFSNVLLCIFSLEDSSVYIDERFDCLEFASRNKFEVAIPEDTQNYLVSKILETAEKYGYQAAGTYFSPLTKAEKELAFDWWRNSQITLDGLNKFFPDLVSYLGNSSMDFDQSWLNEYFIAYKQAKTKNEYSADIRNYINTYNRNITEFNSWYQDFKTTKTVLFNRSDIEVYYWIDGLGVEWIPFIVDLISSYNREQIYLNELHIARSFLPSTTEENKKSLKDLCVDLKKVGDLDEHAHSVKNTYPEYIIDEFEIVKKAVREIISNFSGKKIAIVSDHGLTALSQLCEGLNLAGVDSDHHGRVAKCQNKTTSSNDYIIIENNSTLCALNHKSLCGKIRIGQSAHGGCTPEEVLVPIFIVSNSKNVVNWKATLLTREVMLASSSLEYKIIGLSQVANIQLVYNGKSYGFEKKSPTGYVCENINITQSVDEVELFIDGKSQIDTIKIKAAAEENDLFDF